MKDETYRTFMGYLWYQKDENIFTVGVTEEGLEQIEKINSIDLPREGESIEEEVVVGSLETDDGPLDIYAPVSGEIIELNSQVLEEPGLIQEDPYEAWLFKVETEEDYDDTVDEDETDDEDEDEEFDEEEEE